MARMRFMDGAVVLDKPRGITSFGAVKKVRHILGIRKIGHLGTLDPMGTGVLPLLLGRATRLARFFLGHRREYVATIRFGWATSTYDADGEAEGETVPVAVDSAKLEGLLREFTGEIMQAPPPVSAKKVAGVRAYKLARERRPVELDPVAVTIEELELVELDGPHATIRCLCSAGTYVRSLAHDLGRAVGCGAHVAELRRTVVGDFTLENALTPDDLRERMEAGRMEDALQPPADLLPEIPVQRVDEAGAARIRFGQDFRVSPFGSARDSRLVKAVDPEGRLLCLGKAVSPRLFHPFIVLA